LPFEAYSKIACFLRYDHNRRKYVFGGEKADFRLITSKEMQVLFPGSEIISQAVTFMPETLISFGGDIKKRFYENN